MPLRVTQQHGSLYQLVLPVLVRPSVDGRAVYDLWSATIRRLSSRVPSICGQKPSLTGHLHMVLAQTNTPPQLWKPKERPVPRTERLNINSKSIESHPKHGAPNPDFADPLAESQIAGRTRNARSQTLGPLLRPCLPVRTLSTCSACPLRPTAAWGWGGTCSKNETEAD